MSNKEKKLKDEEVRRLVVGRLKASPSDTIKSIGGSGIYTREELIQHVQAGDEIGKTIEKAQMEWLRAVAEGVLYVLYE